MSTHVPIRADDCLAGIDVTEPRLSPDGRLLAWVRSGANGARIVVRSLIANSGDSISPFEVRSGRSLGGGCFDWMSDGVDVVAVTREGDLCSWNVIDGTSTVLVRGTDRTLSSPVSDTDGRRVAYVVDQEEIRIFDRDSDTDRRVDKGDDAFVFDPVWLRGRVVWQAWSPPHMPWDESRLVSEEGVVTGTANMQCQQPQSTIDGSTLGWLDDSSGWLNVVVEGRARVDESAEHGGPTWGERQRSWCFDSTGTRVAFVRNERGFGRLCTYDLTTGVVTERAKAVHGQLSWRRDSLAAIRTGGRTPTQIVVYDTSGEEWPRTVIEVGPSYDWASSEALVEPELLVVDAPDGTHLHARLYRSVSEAVPRPEREGSRRMLCWLHGGPTDQWQVTFMARFAYWLDRGFDILVPDYRGSTGHGRAYTQALRGRWGELDADDVRIVIADVQSRFDYSQDSVAIMGASAGGLTALSMIATADDLVACAVVAYPVSDISGLDDVTHRFEAHYNRSLVGSPQDTRRLSAERSPLSRAPELARTPLLIFHGTDDHVVPIEQSRQLVAELTRCGGDVELVVFEGEGHGFRTMENKIAEFTRTEEFLGRHLTS